MLSRFRKRTKIIFITIIFSGLILTLLVSFSLGLFSNGCCGNDDCGLYETYDVSSIEIDGHAFGPRAHNWSWASTKEWCSGTGSYEDPYIIEKICIQNNKKANYIVIKNTKAYFIIQGCAIYNSGSDWEDDCGIKLDNVENGKILNNKISLNEKASGITLINSDNNIIEGNTINENGINGIRLTNSNDNTIQENTITKNDWAGINLYESHDNKIKENTINENKREGICLIQSDNNIIKTNTINSNRDYGIYLLFSKKNSISDNVLIDNGESIFNDESHDNSFERNQSLTSSTIWLIIGLSITTIIIATTVLIQHIRKKKTKTKRLGIITFRS